MSRFDLEKRIEFALNDLVCKRHTFSLAEVNKYLGPKNKMGFEEIFEIAYPILSKMNVSLHGATNPIGIVVSVKEPFVSKVHVVQEYFPGFYGRWRVECHY